MQVTETKNEGLAREWEVRVPAAQMAAQMDAHLKSLGASIKMPGFRPGHIPMSVLKQRFAKDALGEVLDRVVTQSTQNALKERGARAALAPKVQMNGGFEDGKDLVFTMAFETMPEAPVIEYDAVTIEKLHCPVPAEEIDATLARIAEANKTYTRAEKGVKAVSGDQLVLDFLGKIDGVAFEGGEAKQFRLTLGSGQFIEGFEGQLEGVGEDEERLVKVTFPSGYHKEELSGKPAEFTVNVHEIHHGAAPQLDDAFAQKLGFADLAALRAQIERQLGEGYEATARMYMKKQLFDVLEKDYRFDVPKGMEEMEFANIWKSVEQARAEGDTDLAGKSEEALRAEYGRIAHRRVKLGILLSDVAVKNKIAVGQEELSQAVMRQAREFPGQEKRVFEFYQKNPERLDDFRGPLLEEKAVDFILDKVNRKERNVTKDELAAITREIEEGTHGENDAQEESDDTGKAKRATKKAANA